MFKPIQFPPEIEPLVRFVEETEPALIVEETLAKLRNGTSADDMIRASALAIVRSTDLPPNHHGGPVHPISGVHAVRSVSQRLPGELAYLPVVQHTTLCNNHCHSLLMGPYLMTEIQPREGSTGDVETYHISDVALRAVEKSEAAATDSVATTIAAFKKSLVAMQASAAQHYFLWLIDHLSPGELLDLLMPIAISRNNLDDHNFIYPVYTARALEAIGREWAGVLFRPAIRYQARPPTPLDDVELNYVAYESVEAIFDEYKLLECDIPLRSSAEETEQIGALSRQIGASKSYYATIAPLAEALVNGLSLEGAGEALSIGAAAAYLSTSYGNPMDSHTHTGINNRRYVLAQEGVSLRNKLLGLMTALTGPEVLLAEPLTNWTSNVEEDVTSHLPARSQDALLDALTESVEGQPWLDWRSIGVDNVVAPDEVKETVALARQYSELGYDAGAYFERLAEISCRDDFTEMHSLKHFQAIVDEYYATREPYRWLHLVSAAKSAAVTHVGKEHQVYNQAKAVLAA